MTFQNPLFDPTAQPTPADTTPGPVPRPLTPEEEVHKQNLLRQLRELQERHRRPVPPPEEGQTGGSILSKLPSRAKLVAAAKKAGVAAAMVAAVLLAKYGVDHKEELDRKYGPAIMRGVEKVQAGLDTVNEAALDVADEIDYATVPARQKIARTLRDWGAYSVARAIQPPRIARATHEGERLLGAMGFGAGGGHKKSHVLG
jgi:hypothetical protein